MGVRPKWTLLGLHETSFPYLLLMEKAARLDTFPVAANGND